MQISIGQMRSAEEISEAFAWEDFMTDLFTAIKLFYIILKRAGCKGSVDTLLKTILVTYCSLPRLLPSIPGIIYFYSIFPKVKRSTKTLHNIWTLHKFSLGPLFKRSDQLCDNLREIHFMSEFRFLLCPIGR